jgi:hypothetical protein
VLYLLFVSALQSNVLVGINGWNNKGEVEDCGGNCCADRTLCRGAGGNSRP